MKTFVELSIDRFEQLRDLVSKTLDQITEDHAHWSPDPESNSIAIIAEFRNRAQTSGIAVAKASQCSTTVAINSQLCRQFE